MQRSGKSLKIGKSIIPTLLSRSVKPINPVKTMKGKIGESIILPLLFHTNAPKDIKIKRQQFSTCHRITIIIK